MRDFLISIVIPVYEEEKHIYTNIYRIHNILNDNGIKHEFILVDDGSKDNTWEILKRLVIELPKVKALRLSRNFGKEAALCAGLEVVIGNACVVMDADLQHPPEIIPNMVKLWHEDGYDLVEGVRISRKGQNFINKLSVILFYNILQRIIGYKIKNLTDFKLMDAKIINALKSINERDTFFREMTIWIGFKRISIPFEVNYREKRKSRWSIIKLFKYSITATISFSSIPLQIVTFLGFLLLILDIPIAIDSLICKFRGQTIDGITTITFLLLIIGSSIMISLGIIGCYIAKIFEEVKHRPRYLLSERFESN